MNEQFDGTIRVAEQDASMQEAYLPVLYAPDSHSANLHELDNGDLLCVWFNGSGEGNPDTNVVMSRLPNGSRQWTEPVELANHPQRSEQNPLLFQDPQGKLWLLHTQSEPHDQKSASIIVRKSDDRGQAWTDPQILFEGPGLFLRNGIVILKNGDWVLPAYYCTSGGDYSVVKISSDQGRTWQEHVLENARYRVQMSVVERDDGTLFAMFRSRKSDRIYVSESNDNGKTWLPLRKSPLPNNNSSIQLTKLQSGHLALAYNDATMERDQFRFVKNGNKLRKKAVRTPLTIAVSEDGGQSWPHICNVQVADEAYEKRPVGYSYPSIVQARDGMIHIAFSYLRQTIKHIIINEEWVKNYARFP